MIILNPAISACILLCDHQMMSMAIYMAIYILVAALSLPGAAVMTLAGGAIFGFWYGLVLVSFASTIGATLAFLVARFLLRDTVQKKFGDRLKTVNHGVEKDGPFTCSPCAWSRFFRFL